MTGEYGRNLSWNRATGVLYLFTADPTDPCTRYEPLAFTTLYEACLIADGWETEGPAVLAKAGLL